MKPIFCGFWYYRHTAPSTDWFWCTPIEVIFLKFMIFLCKQFFFSKKTWKYIFLHFSNLCRRLRAHIEFKRQSQISVRQRRIWGRNFKTKLVTFSVFSCFFRFSVRLCCMDTVAYLEIFKGGGRSLGSGTLTLLQSLPIPLKFGPTPKKKYLFLFYNNYII